MPDPQYVQYGCGLSAPEGWLNFDASPTLRFERIPLVGALYTRNKARFPKEVRYGDIVKGLPLPEGSCHAVYCSHVLEHLALEDCRAALRNTYRILEPGGTFRLVLPDLRAGIENYLKNGTPDAAHQFIRDTHLGDERRRRGVRGLLVAWLSNSKHLWMWDYEALAHELESAGFVDVRRAQFGDSPDPAFSAVEARNRWDDCLGIECRKPT